MSDADKVALFEANVKTWNQRVKSLIQEHQEGSKVQDDALAELVVLHKFLSVRVPTRLKEITLFPSSLKKEYIKFIESFLSEPGLIRFMETYFDVEVFKQVRIRYRKKNSFEKEVSILFDLYKIKKTTETISTLAKAADNPDDHFPSMFSNEDQKEFLTIFLDVLKLFLGRFLIQETRKEVISKLSNSKMGFNDFAEMRKSGVSYVPKEILEGSEYRDRFMALFFSTVMKIKVEGEVREMHFNYLNFEILKTEFLKNWMQKKLAGNASKSDIYKKYKINGRTIAEQIEENP